MIRSLNLVLAALAIASAPTIAHAAPAPSSRHQARARDASIPFANTVGVWNWEGRGDSTVYFESNKRQWYKATLMAPSFDLPFVNYIGIDAGPTGTLDRFGAVYIHGQRYPFSSFVKIAGKPPAVKKH